MLRPEMLVFSKRARSRFVFYEHFKRNSHFFIFLFLSVLPFSFIVCLLDCNFASAASGTITLSVPDNISLDILPTGSGSFASTSATVSVKTTYAAGYTLGIKASNNNSNALINDNDSSKTIPSITSNVSEAIFSSSSAYNNKWGFKPSKLNSASNSDYLPAPSSDSVVTVLDQTVTSNPSTYNDYTLTMGVRVDSTLTPGSYRNVFILTAVANPTPYDINYVENTTDPVTNMPSDASSSTYDTSVNISSTVPARDGYNFKGWCTAQVADYAACTGTTYNPNGDGTDLTWTIDQTAASNSLTLYAMWAKTLLMQDVSQWSSSIAVGQEVEAIDTRDNKTYTVTRFCMEYTGDTCTDSELWMTQNLDFMPDTSDTYTHDDTDLGYTSGDTNATWQPATSLTTPATISSYNSGSNPVSGWTNSDSKPYIAEGGDTYAYNDTIYTSLADCENAHTKADCKHYHIGNYYNWSTSIASNDSSAYTTDLTTAPDSICPAGWRLPEGLTMDGSTVVQSEFNKLLRANGITNGSDTTLGSTGTNVGYTSGGFNKMNTKPYYFVRSGHVDSSTLYYFSTDGYYWSGSALSSRSYYLYFYSGVLYPAVRSYRNYGRSLRCVERRYYMQDVQDWKDDLEVGEERTVYDKRDEKAYTATKFCTEYSGDTCTDSQIWMTQNLDFVPDTTRTYTYNDTDLGHTSGNTSATWQPASSLATPATISAFNSGTTENVVSGWTNDYTHPYIAEGGDTYAYNGTIYTSLADCENAHTEADCKHYHIGNYYNWSTSVASNDSSAYTADPTLAPDSICPAGWRLPKGLTMDGSAVVQSEFNKLLRANGITNGSDTTLGTSPTNVGYTSGGFNKMNTKPYYFVRSGHVYSSTLYYFSTIGYYWSGSAQSSSRSYNLLFHSGELYPAYRSNRYGGWSLRCVAR